MAEACPLRTGAQTFDTTACAFRCRQLWSKAVETGNSPLGYEDFTTSDKALGYDDTDCPHTEVEYAHDSLRALGRHARSYVIVDACGNCGREVGEQGFLYECPLPTTE